MFKKLSEIIKTFEDNVLVIGIDDELLYKFEKNNKVNLYSIYSSKKSNSSIFARTSKKKTNHGKEINIKKLRKYINKKSVNYLLINLEEIIKYYKYVIKDTIFLCNNIIYLYSPNSIDKEFIIKKYERYNVKIEVTDYKNGYIIKINNQTGENNMFKDIVYFLADSLSNVAEFIGNILIS